MLTDFRRENLIVYTARPTALPQAPHLFVDWNNGWRARHPLIDPDDVPSRSKAYTVTPLNFLFNGSSPTTPSAWNPNDTSEPAAIVPFQSAFLIT